mmetsp:Transcript_11749/g.28515  ORF Transcript_11749/g.28515 Transcript_11749/m.28515 type:complete len:279 (+) Transcript_11749:446-1282(+)|eukprot:CAMPEP_0179001776 /NCGR_PEP_ID=MMETSP0795-20121207/11577_1 /TAXON_ID=88552 /ORGANISM="Amoebophrya sp., Strain Ameob2" /LENGTH=278 /DNA_ID=CAMNT_0020695245 /DNA_START=395 /DNA_END=1231 /DNA_ORIENTATION=+
MGACAGKPAAPAAKVESPVAPAPAAAPAAETKEAPAAPAAPAEPSTFYIVDHTFKEDAKPEEWWANIQGMMAEPEKMKAFFKGNSDKGFYNHAFFPLSQTHMICIWEMKPGCKLEDLQACLDEVVGQNMLVNKTMQISPELCGNQMPFASAYAKDSTLAMDASAAFPTKSSWFIVQHDMTEGKADEWWADTQKMMTTPGEMEKFSADNTEKGYANHTFMPASKDLAYCIWEVKADGPSSDDFQAHLDAAVGRGCFVNTLLPVPAEMTGGNCVLKPKFD